MLIALDGNDPESSERLYPLVYDHLRRLAMIYMSRERSNHTLQPTALVHEAYLRITGQKELEFRNRKQFFAIASNVMRQILVDHARARGSLKRGGQAILFSSEDVDLPSEIRSASLLALDEALTRLSTLDERQAKIIELKFFGGFNESEIGELFEISARTVRREISSAKLWLLRELKPG
ncbi:MAG: sigma-70 family RNA polymerase sigma factor [Acidobacteriota bacterium]|nr:MAG: sigma-70 family RNA polymerase sigma factor [Acidobacteriota bacterium]